MTAGIITGPLKPKPIHMAWLANEFGGVSALCFKNPRAIDLRKATWTNRPVALQEVHRDPTRSRLRRDGEGGRVTDVVVTVPKNFTHPYAPGKVGLAAWIAEGDAAGEPWSGEEWDYTTWGHPPKIEPGERVYVVCEGRLRGYAPLIRLIVGGQSGNRSLSFIRGGDAVAVTIAAPIIGFRGWRYRWWERDAEIPFHDWRDTP